MNTFAQYRGIKFYSAGQLWSKPSSRDKEEGIPAMMVKPSFLDLVRLAARHPVDRLLEVNSMLLEEGLIKHERYSQNESMLKSIAITKNALG
jgi:hypothetical protein